jgi:hypothetical protein
MGAYEDDREAGGGGGARPPLSARIAARMLKSGDCVVLLLGTANDVEH